MAKKKAKDSWLNKNTDVGLDDLGFIICGPPAVGKTWAAGMLSKHWPKTLPPKKKVDLKDALWLPFDRGATDGFLEYGISVDQIDVQAMLREMTITQTLEAIQDDLETASEDLNKRIWVVDTVSKLDKLIVTHWTDHQPRTKHGEVDGFGIYRSVLNTHRRFYDLMTQLPGQVIFLCHNKAVPDLQPDGAKRQKAAKGLPGHVDKDLDITGQALGMYYADSSVILTLIARKQGKNWERHFHTQPHMGFPCKNRFQRSLSEKEPADLKKIVAKIEKNL